MKDASFYLTAYRNRCFKEYGRGYLMPDAQGNCLCALARQRQDELGLPARADGLRWS